MIKVVLPSQTLSGSSADWEECGPNIRVRRIVEDEKQGAFTELLTCRHAINVLPFGAQSVFAEQEFYGNLVDNSQEAVANEDDVVSGDKLVKLRKKKVKCFEDYYEDKESKELLKSDPLEWKDQDHYAMLGLSNLRAEASQDDIKKAYRKKVLKHHPDKKAAEEKTKKGHDNFFKCVQKAFEVLSDPVKRRQFDSVDKFFDDSIPSKLDDKSVFFDVFGPVFERNARFSVKKNIPDLGDEDTPRAQVESFYNFWTNFQSWRSFELMDEEPVDDSMSRDERRWYERQNKAQREKLKREENARIHKLVDAAISSDPRVQKFKEEDRILKEQKKKEKEEAAARMKAEAQKKEELRLKEIEDEKKRLEKEKNEKIELKAELKKCRRELRGLFKNLNSEDSKKLDAVIFNFGDNLEQLKAFFEHANSSADSLSLLSEASESIPKDTPKVQAENRAESSNVAKESSEEKPWSVEELKLLIKAVNMFPGGTLSRWEKIADFLEQHTGVKRSNKELTKKSNEVRGADFLKFKANSLQESEKVQSEPVGEATLKEQPEPAAQSKPWTAEEQAQLEKAMKEFPASKYKGSERWDKVATRVSGRSKKEIMQRVKEIVQALKAKQK